MHACTLFIGMRVTGPMHTCTLPHMRSHSIIARVELATGVRVPCMGEDSVVAARHCFQPFLTLAVLAVLAVLVTNTGLLGLGGAALARTELYFVPGAASSSFLL